MKIRKAAKWFVIVLVLLLILGPVRADLIESGAATQADFYRSGSGQLFSGSSSVTSSSGSSSVTSSSGSGVFYEKTVEAPVDAVDAVAAVETSEAEFNSYGYDSDGFGSSDSDSYSGYDSSASSYAGKAYYASEESGAVTDNGASEESGAVADNGASVDQVNVSTGRKLIRTITLDLEALDFDGCYDDLKSAVQACGGYFEDSSIRSRDYFSSSDLRTGTFTIRIPVSAADTFTEAVGGLGNVVSRSESARDVTLEYTDNESRVKALRIQQENLLEMLEKAETVEDMLAIQTQLSNVEYELEYYQSSLNRLENQVEYMTIYLNIDEVEEVTPPPALTFRERIQKGWSDSVKNFAEDSRNLVIGLIIRLPYIAVLAVLAGIVLLVRRARTKSKLESGKSKNVDSKAEDSDAE